MLRQKSSTGFWKCVPAILGILALSLLCLASSNSTSGTAPFILDGNRIYAELAFQRPDGTLRKIFAFVDLGSPSMVLSEELFRELLLDRAKPLIFNVGSLPVSIDPKSVTSESWLPFSIGDSRRVEALLPAGVLRNYEVVIDYAHRKLTLAQPGTLKPAGTQAPVRVSEKTGLAAVDVSIDGHLYPVTIDAGSAYTWLSKRTVQEWLNPHPDWQRGVGAVGVANMRMADDGIEAAGILVRIPEMKLGPLQLKQIGALAIGPDKTGWDFVDWYSGKNPAPVIGWLGGNVLRDFRITIDYRNRMTYWLRQTESDRHDLDQVGLTLTKKSGEYFVAAIAIQNGRPAVDGVQPGDKLIQIGSLQTQGATSSEIISAMHGKPGELRTLVLERDKKQFKVQAKVTRF